MTSALASVFMRVIQRVVTMGKGNTDNGGGGFRGPRGERHKWTSYDLCSVACVFVSSNMHCECLI